MSRQFPGSGTSDYLINTDSLGLDEPYTVMAWVYMDDATSDSVFFGQYRSSSSNKWTAEIRANASTGAAVASKRNTSVIDADTATTMSDDTWYHVCGVFSANNSRSIYLDGSAANKGTSSTDVSDPSGINRQSIGQRTDSSPNANCAGMIAHVCVWSVALSESEIADLASGDNPLTVQAENIVAYWPLAGDDSPEPDVVNGHDMTVTGTVTQGASDPTVDAPPAEATNFAVIESVTETAITGTPTDHSADLPATVNAGDVLLAAVSIRQDDPVAGESVTSAADSTADNWTELFQDTRAAFLLYGVWMKDADGDEGGETFDFTSSDNGNAVCQIFRISGADGITSGVEYDTVTDGADTIDPPSVEASWGALDNLWISTVHGADDDATVSDGPDGFSTPNELQSGGGTNNGCEVAEAHLDSASATVNPTAWTLSESEAIAATTIVIKPSGDRTATFALTLDAPTLAATADVLVEGAFAVTLPLPVLAATADAIAQGDVAFSTGLTPVLAADAQAIVQGDVAVTLSPPSLLATVGVFADIKNSRFFRFVFKF